MTAITAMWMCPCVESWHVCQGRCGKIQKAGQCALLPLKGNIMYEYVWWVHKCVYLQNRKEERRAMFRENPQKTNGRMRLSGPGRTLNKKKPTSCLESPPVQPIKVLILIWLMIWIQQIHPDYDSWALRGPHDYEMSPLPSYKQTRVTQMS